LDSSVMDTFALSFRSPLTDQYVRVYLGTVGYWAGAFDLTNWSVNGDRKDNANVSITLESNGALGEFQA